MVEPAIIIARGVFILLKCFAVDKSTFGSAILHKNSIIPIKVAITQGDSNAFPKDFIENLLPCINITP